MSGNEDKDVILSELVAKVMANYQETPFEAWHRETMPKDCGLVPVPQAFSMIVAAYCPERLVDFMTDWTREWQRQAEDGRKVVAR